MGTLEVLQKWGGKRERVTRDLRENLLKAQNRINQIADRHRIDKEFKVGNFVFLKLQPYRQSTVAERRNLKLSSRYYGPFEVLERIGPVAYRLLLPEGSKVHPAFYVSLMKMSPPEGQPASPTAPSTGEDEQPRAKPKRIIDRRSVRRGNKAVAQVLENWSNLLEDRTTWEDYWSLKTQFRDFDP